MVPSRSGFLGAALKATIVRCEHIIRILWGVKRASILDERSRWWREHSGGSRDRSRTQEAEIAVQDATG